MRRVTVRLHRKLPVRGLVEAYNNGPPRPSLEERQPKLSLDDSRDRVERIQQDQTRGEHDRPSNSIVVLRRGDYLPETE